MWPTVGTVQAKKYRKEKQQNKAGARCGLGWLWGSHSSRHVGRWQWHHNDEGAWEHALAMWSEGWEDTEEVAHSGGDGAEEALEGEAGSFCRGALLLPYGCVCWVVAVVVAFCQVGGAWG